MNKHVIESFAKHRGRRGATFYDEERCSFLTWSEVLLFLDAIAEKKSVDDIFAERLTEALANYDPDSEFLAVQQNDDSISVELFSFSVNIPG